MYVKHRGPGSRGGTSESTRRRALRDPPMAITVIEGAPVALFASVAETPLQMLRRYQRRSDEGPAAVATDTSSNYSRNHALLCEVERLIVAGRSPWRSWRETLGLTILEVSARWGAPAERLRQIENRTHKPGREEEEALAAAMGIKGDLPLALALRPFLKLLHERARG